MDSKSSDSRLLACSPTEQTAPDNISTESWRPVCTRASVLAVSTGGSATSPDRAYRLLARGRGQRPFPCGVFGHLCAGKRHGWRSTPQEAALRRSCGIKATNWLPPDSGYWMHGRHEANSALSSAPPGALCQRCPICCRFQAEAQRPVAPSPPGLRPKRRLHHTPSSFHEECRARLDFVSLWLRGWCAQQWRSCGEWDRLLCRRKLHGWGMAAWIRGWHL